MVLNPAVRIAFVASLVLAAGCGAATESSKQADSQPPPGQGKSDEFLVVDCLLPGQIRRLGANFNYLTPRRPVKTSARDCEIRGGEYVQYDRANYATALKVWLPMAEQGDPAAQTYVGEIFEKGLGVPPDHQAAATWYRKAADRGFSRAAINLGNLYERGLGVPKDPQQALNWYRRAAGLPELDFTLSPATGAAAADQSQTQIAELRRELRVKSAELEQARSEAESSRRKLEELRQEAGAEKTALDGLRRELETLRQKEQMATAKARDLQSAIAQKEARLTATGREIEALGKSVEQAEAASRAQRTPLERQVTELRAALARAEADAAAQRAGLEQLRREMAAAGPEIELVQVQLIEPQVAMITRDVQVRPKAAATGRMVMMVGRVKSPGGLGSVTVNGREETLDKDNLFRSQIPLSNAETRIRIVATDRAGRRSVLELMAPRVEPVVVQTGQRTVAGTGPQAGRPRPQVSLGTYHALVIGINDYRNLPRLRTAVADAQEVTNVLRKLYGFQVTQLINPTRYEILSALNNLRERLTSRDNLLVYYAGHGEVDQKNQRGHWLPVDAEPRSSANWIANDDITSVLNITQARQVLVIADSCYAGTLTRSALANLDPGLTEQEMLDVIKRMAEHRSRMVMTSGGVEPVLDSAGGRHSVFAEAFVQLLRDNDGLIMGREVFRRLQLRVAATAQRVAVPQVPEYAPIKFAGHEAGDFIFVRGTDSQNP